MQPTTTGPVSPEAPIPPAADRVRIVATPGTCGGRPRIDGHRIKVEDVAIWHERMAMSPDEIVSAHPSLTLSEVHAALAYYYENRDQIDADILEGYRKFLSLAHAQGNAFINNPAVALRPTQGVAQELGGIHDVMKQPDLAKIQVARKMKSEMIVLQCLGGKVQKADLISNFHANVGVFDLVES